MAVWLVRAGQRGEQETFALEHSIAVVGWGDLPDLGNVKSREDLEAHCLQTYPDAKRNTIINCG